MMNHRAHRGRAGADLWVCTALIVLVAGAWQPGWAQAGDPGYDPARWGDLPLERQGGAPSDELPLEDLNWQHANRAANIEIDRAIEREKRSAAEFIEYLKETQKRMFLECQNTPGCDPMRIVMTYHEEIKRAEQQRDERIQALEGRRMTPAQEQEMTRRGALRDVEAGGETPLPPELRHLMQNPQSAQSYSPQQHADLGTRLYNQLYQEATSEYSDEERQQQEPERQRHLQMLRQGIYGGMPSP